MSLQPRRLFEAVQFQVSLGLCCGQASQVNQRSPQVMAILLAGAVGLLQFFAMACAFGAFIPLLIMRLRPARLAQGCLGLMRRR